MDGAATGDDGTSRSINNGVDKVVFDLLRDLADALVVGAGTIRIEGYAVGRKPLVVVSRSGSVPPTQREAASGKVLMATVVHRAVPRRGARDPRQRTTCWCSAPTASTWPG